MPTQGPNETRAEFWRSRAEEARAMAGESKNPETKRILVGIADSYDRIAALAAKKGE